MSLTQQQKELIRDAIITLADQRLRGVATISEVFEILDLVRDEIKSDTTTRNY